MKNLGFKGCLLLGFMGCDIAAPNAAVINAGGRQVGGFRGYYAIESRLQQVVFDVNFSLIRAIDPDAYQPGALGMLLGGYQGTAGDSTFKNFRPNGINMLLWNLAASNLATSLQEVCLTKRPEIDNEMFSTYIQTHIFQAIMMLCAAQVDGRSYGQASLTLWQIFIGFEAPRGEYVAWSEYFLQPEKDSQISSANRVTEMMRSLMLHPYFLLEQ